ncbi:MAG: ABC transporter [Promethearchaeota archaeon]|nr:MAG: ABC transporter [Candidatus Lokiarchaeota archaeon]
MEKEDKASNDSNWSYYIEQIKRSLAISKKNIKIYYNKGPVIIQGLIVPAMLFFAFTIGRDIQPVYLTSGLMAMVLFLTAASIGPVVFPWETRQKTLERLITCPVSIRTILLGDVWGSFLFGTIFAFPPLLFGLIFFSLWGSLNLLVIIAGIIIGAFSFACFSIILSVPPTDNPGNIMIFTLSIKFPLVFLSALFVPVEMAPYSIISPVTYFIDIVNFGLTGKSAFGPLGLLLDFGILAAFGMGFLFLAFKLHELVLQRRFSG